MKKNYELEGMSCGGCANSVKRVLLMLPEVEDADIQLNPQRAIITMQKDIGVEKLQAQLKKAGHYTIKEAVLNQ